MDHAKIIGDVQEALYDVKKLQEERPPFVEREEILNLKFKEGQRVVDKKTGKKGVILRGERVQITV